MSDQHCELCGQRVKVVGKTTMHYAGIDAHELALWKAEALAARELYNLNLYGADTWVEVKKARYLYDNARAATDAVIKE